MVQFDRDTETFIHVGEFLNINSQSGAAGTGTANAPFMMASGQSEENEVRWSTRLAPPPPRLPFGKMFNPRICRQ